VLFASLSQGAEFDIVVNERAIVQRCVMDKAARNIAVGMPGGFNFSFDPVRGRLAYVWFGDFLDFQPEVTARGGRKVEILGSKRMVGTAAIPLRIGDSQKVPESIQFDGYRKEPATGIPTFLFRVDGVNVEQRVLSFGHDQVTIELSFPDASEPETQDSIRYYHMDSSAVQTVELSERLTMQDGIIEIPADQSWAQIQLKLKPSKEKFVRKEPSTSGPLLYALHCNSCHTLDGKKKIGPSFADLWTSKRNVTRDGVSSEIQVDEAYIRESILEPQAAVVQGYEQANKMVDIRKTLNEKQIDALVQFLLDLKP
jgi:cytochrome c oxidase subunit 2